MRITEDYVSFETAKLLKEKGFKGECLGVYFPNGRFDTFDTAFDYNLNDGNLSHAINAPTLQMTMKWLRETHNCVINVNYIDFLEHGEVWSYTIINKSTFAEYYKDTENSYKLACEEAIKYCLEKII